MRSTFRNKTKTNDFSLPLPATLYLTRLIKYPTIRYNDGIISSLFSIDNGNHVTFNDKLTTTTIIRIHDSPYKDN